MLLKWKSSKLLSDISLRPEVQVYYLCILSGFVYLHIFLLCLQFQGLFFFYEYRILGWWCFSSVLWRCHFILIWLAFFSDEKWAVIIVHLYVICLFFSGPFLRLILLFGFQKFDYDVLRCGFFPVFIWLELVEFLEKLWLLF